MQAIKTVFILVCTCNKYHFLKMNLEPHQDLGWPDAVLLCQSVLLVHDFEAVEMFCEVQCCLHCTCSGGVIRLPYLLLHNRLTNARRC